MIGVAVLGYGYWGPNLVRNFSESPATRLVGVCDLSEDELARVRARYPAVRTTPNPDELIDAPDVDAVAIATPVSTHFDLSLQALRAGKHVLVEKPLAANSEQAMRLIDEADRRRLTLMVDHTFLYTGPVRKIRELVSGGALGDVYYFDSVRVNLGLFQQDVSVLWDLAVHDLSIMDYVLSRQPTAVSATGISHVPGQPENIAYLTTFFDGGLIGHLHVNWLAPVKIRRTLISGSRRMVVYDDLEPSEKIKIYDKGITVDGGAERLHEILIGYRTGDMTAPKLDVTEALHNLVNDFADSIEHGRKPISDGALGLRVVQILEAAEQSIAERGQPAPLSLRP